MLSRTICYFDTGGSGELAFSSRPAPGQVRQAWESLPLRGFSSLFTTLEVLVGLSSKGFVIVAIDIYRSEAKFMPEIKFLYYFRGPSRPR